MELSFEFIGNYGWHQVEKQDETKFEMNCNLPEHIYFEEIKYVYLSLKLSIN